MSFIKKEEDFICENCGVYNIGDGYTNHCLKCLFSKHVDNNPGDRSNKCLGLMRPVYVSYTNKNKFIIHKCVVCGFEKKNLVQVLDSIDTMIEIQKKTGDSA